MVKLYKMDCNGNLYFVDYGLPHKVEDYRLRGYVVKRAVQPHQRVPVPQRGKIECTHRIAKKKGFFARFVDDCKHNLQVMREIKEIFVPQSKRSKTRDARAYFETRALAAA